MSLRAVTSEQQRAMLGESPLWSVAEQALYFVDILGRAIHRFEPSMGSQRSLAIAEDIGCIGFWPGGGFIAVLRSGVGRMDAAATALKKLADNPEDQRFSRFNDGCVDPRGRFLAGTIDEPKDGGRAYLYRYDRDGLSVLASGLMTSNGVAFSPDGGTLHHADTPRLVVYAYDYDVQTGAAANRRVFVSLTTTGDDSGRPDGAAVDAEGCYWTALYEAGRIQRYSPAGELLAEHRLAAKCPTMIAFGGTDLKTVFITTASAGADDAERAAFPDAGRVFAMTVDVPALPQTTFNPEA